MKKPKSNKKQRNKQIKDYLRKRTTKKNDSKWRKTKKKNKGQ
jgi:hypothetical protein